MRLLSPILISMLLACTHPETEMSASMQEAVELFEQSHQLYDALKMEQETLTQLSIRLQQDTLSERDSIREQIRQVQQALDVWHKELVSVGEHEHGQSHGHDPHEHEHHQQEVQVTDQQMLEIQQEQFEQIREISRQMHLLLDQ